MDFVALLSLGFFLGMRHATDADHVVAVTTIVSRHRSIRSAAQVGLWWGLGHTLTVLVVGTGIVAFGWVIPPRLGLSMEFSVGLMLILLGVVTLYTSLRRIDQTVEPLERAGHVHSHVHRHGDYIHTHPHGHGPEVHPHAPDETPLARIDRRFGRVRVYQSLRPLIVGMVHGLAGSAAVALIVVAAIGDARQALLCLGLFGVGTIAGMMLITAVIAAPFAWSRARSAHINRALRIASGLLSLAFGVLLAWRIGIVDGLLTGTATWNPQ